MSKILISGDNCSFKQTIMNTLLKSQQCIIIHLDDINDQRSLLSSQIDYYDYFYNLLYDNFIKEIDNIFHILNYKSEDIFNFIRYIFFIKNLSFTNKESLVDLIIRYSHTYNFNKDIKKALDNQVINLEEFEEILSEYDTLHHNILNQESALIGLLLKKKSHLLQSIKDTRCIKIDTQVNQKLYIHIISNMINKEFINQNIKIIIIENKICFNDESLLELVETLDDSFDICGFFHDVFIHHDCLDKLMLFFDYYIYNRHSMKSSEYISKLLGEVLVTKYSYTLDKDRRFRNNTLLDRLFNTNKVEHYTTQAPVREPKVFKEEIADMDDTLCLSYSKESKEPIFIDWKHHMNLLENDILYLLGYK